MTQTGSMGLISAAISAAPQASLYNGGSAAVPQDPRSAKSSALGGLQVEHRNRTTRNHRHRQLAIPLLGLNEVNQCRISGERLAAGVDGVGLGAAAELD